MDDGIGSWPTKHASRTPERVALIDGDTGAELTWADLEARTNALAAALRSKFDTLAMPVLGEAGASALAEAVLDMDRRNRVVVSAEAA